MKGLGRNTGIVLCAVLLALTIGTSGALAYFSDYETAQGGVTLNLVKTLTIEEGTDPKEKNIVIKNTGGENDADVVVRVSIYGPDGYMKITVPDNWVDGDDGWYYYKGVLAPGQDTGTAINAKICNPDGSDLSKKQIAELGEGFEVTVVQEAEIATYKQVNGKNVVQNPEGWNLPVITVE